MGQNGEGDKNKRVGSVRIADERGRQLQNNEQC